PVITILALRKLIQLLLVNRQVALVSEPLEGFGKIVVVSDGITLLIIQNLLQLFLSALQTRFHNRANVMLDQVLFDLVFRDSTEGLNYELVASGPNILKMKLGDIFPRT